MVIWKMESKAYCKDVDQWICRREDGLSITKDDQLQMENHAASCPDCRAELVALDLLRDPAPGGALGPMDELSQRRTIDDILLRRTHADQRSLIPRRRAALLGLAAGLAAIGMTAIATWFAGRESPGAAVEDTVVPKSASQSGIAFGTFEEVRGRMTQGGHAVTENSTLIVGKTVRVDRGDGIIAVRTGIRLMAETGTQFRALPLTDKTLTVNLVRGTMWVEVDPDQEGPRFCIRTSDGTIEVRGTIVRVSADSKGVVADVLQGMVRIAPRRGPVFELTSGTTAEIAQRAVRVLTAEENQDRSQTLERISFLKYHDRALLDGAGQGDDVTIKSQMSEEPSIKQAKIRPLSAGTLLAQARALRREQDWQGVADAYEKLIRRHWGTDEANAALVALGQVRLEKLKDPANALGWFESYLDTGATALIAEALYSKARALRALGDAERERKTLTQLIERFPSAIQATAAKKRLHALWDSEHGKKPVSQHRR